MTVGAERLKKRASRSGAESKPPNSYCQVKRAFFSGPYEKSRFFLKEPTLDACFATQTCQSPARAAIMLTASSGERYTQEL
jgi:hypothetical protein